MGETKTKNKNEMYYTDGVGIKNITLPQFSNDAWTFYGDAPDDKKADLYASVAGVFRAANLSASAIGNLPFALVTESGDDYDTSNDWQNKIGMMKNPRELMRLWRLSLFMTNTAYGFVEKSRGKKSIRYIVPSTITPIVDERDGLLGFTRTIGVAKKDYLYSQFRPGEFPIVHIWRNDFSTELVPTKNSEYKAASASAGVLYYADYYIQHFFKRGGIRPTILSVKGAPGEDAKKDIERIWDKVMRGFYQYLAKVMNADVITPIVLGDGIETLKDTELYQSKMSDIALACGIPLSLLLANSANYATADVEYLQWFRDSVVPWADFMADQLNDNLFDQMGLRLEFRPEVTDPGQEDEVQRMEAAQRLYNILAAANVENAVPIALGTMGVEPPPELQSWDNLVYREAEEPEPSETPQLQPEESPIVAEQPAPSVRFIPTIEQYREMELWQTMAFRKHKRDESIDFQFKCKTLPDDIADEIRARLMQSTDEDGIKYAFDFFGMASTDVPAVKREISGRDSIESRMARALEGKFEEQRKELLSLLGDPPDINNIPSSYWDDAGKGIAEAVRPILQDIYIEQAQALMGTISIGVDMAVVNTMAIEWASSYAYDLVKGINDVTRKGIAEAVRLFYERGFSIDELQDDLSRYYNSVRARMIAVTETTRAGVEGERQIAEQIARDSGVQMIPVWNTAADELVCPICGPRHNQEITDGKYPPAHPNCRCWVTYRLPDIE